VDTWGSRPWGASAWGLADAEPLEPAGYEFDLEIPGPVDLTDPFSPQDVFPAPYEFELEIRGPMAVPDPALLQDVLPAAVEFTLEIRGPMANMDPPQPGLRFAPLTVDGVANVKTGSVSPAENDKGTGSFTAPVVPAEGTDVVISVGGEVALAGVVVTGESAKVTSEEYGVVHQASVEGHLREWENVLVLPDFGGGVTGGVARLGAPVVKTRFFDWTMNGGVLEETDYGTARTFGRDVISAALDPNPANRIDLPDNWPDEFAEWMHASKPGLAPAGWTNFRARTGSAGGPTSFWMANYDYGECWVDGKLIITCDSAGQAKDVTEDLKPGFHHDTIRSHNGGGRAGTLFTAMPVSGGRYGEAILHSSGGWLSAGYQRNPAPLTVGGVIVRLLREAKARGCLTGWSLTFDKDRDSNGRPWQTQTESLTADVGMTMREMLDRYAETLLDFYPSGRTLSAVVKDSGRPGSIADPWTLGVNLESAGTQGSLW
jgi:hypothetical protein